MYSIMYRLCHVCKSVDISTFKHAFQRIHMPTTLLLNPFNAYFIHFNVNSSKAKKDITIPHRPVVQIRYRATYKLQCQFSDVATFGIIKFNFTSIN